MSVTINLKEVEKDHPDAKTKRNRFGRTGTMTSMGSSLASNDMIVSKEQEDEEIKQQAAAT